MLCWELHRLHPAILEKTAKALVKAGVFAVLELENWNSSTALNPMRVNFLLAKVKYCLCLFQWSPTGWQRGWRSGRIPPGSPDSGAPNDPQSGD